jgi:hypothetical protein
MAPAWEIKEVRIREFITICGAVLFLICVISLLVADNVNRIYQAQEVLCGGDPEVTWKHTDATEFLSAFYMPERYGEEEEEETKQFKPKVKSATRCARMTEQYIILAHLYHAEESVEVRRLVLEEVEAEEIEDYKAGQNAEYIAMSNFMSAGEDAFCRDNDWMLERMMTHCQESVKYPAWYPLPKAPSIFVESGFSVSCADYAPACKDAAYSPDGSGFLKSDPMWKELAPDYYNDDMVSNYPWLMLLQTICPVTCEWSAGYCTAEDDEKDGPPPGMGPAPSKTVPVGCVCEAFNHPTLGAAPAGCSAVNGQEDICFVRESADCPDAAPVYMPGSLRQLENAAGEKMAWVECKPPAGPPAS